MKPTRLSIKCDYIDCPNMARYYVKLPDVLIQWHPKIEIRGNGYRSKLCFKHKPEGIMFTVIPFVAGLGENRVKCLRCGATWEPAVDNMFIPVKCKYCRSRYWRAPKQIFL